jgi:AcrR family transcriptional regulator
MKSTAKMLLAEDGEQGPLRDRILALATELFIRHGYKGVSFLGIARELGVTHSHIHYYFRTKAVLGEAALDAYVERAKADFRDIWTSVDSDLLTRFVRSRDWIHRSYAAFNPDAVGRQNWGLLSRFADEAELMTPAARKTLRTSLEDIDSYIDIGIGHAIAAGEIAPDAPRHALVLQISSLLHASRQITRFEGSFRRLDDLLRWTFEVIHRAYGNAAPIPAWPQPGGPASRSRRSRPRVAARLVSE